MAEFGVGPMVGIVLLVCLFSLQNLQPGFSSTNAEDPSSSLHNNKAKLTKFAAAPTLKFLYW